MVGFVVLRTGVCASSTCRVMVDYVLTRVGAGTFSTYMTMWCWVFNGAVACASSIYRGISGYFLARDGASASSTSMGIWGCVLTGTGLCASSTCVGRLRLLFNMSCSCVTSTVYWHEVCDFEKGLLWEI